MNKDGYVNFKWKQKEPPSQYVNRNELVNFSMNRCSALITIYHGYDNGFGLQVTTCHCIISLESFNDHNYSCAWPDATKLCKGIVNRCC